MSEPPPDSAHEKLAATLVVRRRIHATPEKLFAAWTQPEHLVRWWGPQGVACPAAEIDLRVGGAYRIATDFKTAPLFGSRVYSSLSSRPIDSSTPGNWSHTGGPQSE
jgi:hypothetical protein